MAAIENHTLWFSVIFIQGTGGSVAVCVVDSWSFNTYMCEHTFPMYYRILIQGDKTHPLIFIVGTINFIEYLQRYQILIFIYYIQI